MVSRTRSDSSKTSARSSAASGPYPDVETGSQNSIRHREGSGTTPSGPSHGKVGVTGKYGAPVSRAIAGSSGQLRVDLLASDHGDRHDRSAGAQRDLCKPAAPEALEPVTLAKRLARALRALREDSHELLLLEQPLGVAGGGDDSSQLPHRHGHAGKVERPVEDQEAGMAGQRMLAEDRERDHRGVP